MTESFTLKKRRRKPFTQRLAGALALQGRVVMALFQRETRTRFGFSTLGYSWTLIEPGSNVLIWVLLFYVLDRRPPLGDSMLVFVASAFFPLMLFRNISGFLVSAISANRSLLQFPIVHNIDVIFARTLLEVATFFAVFFLYFGLFGIFGLQWFPTYPLELLGVLLLIALFGFGVGTTNAVLTCLFPSWPKIYAWVQRAFYLTSGVFFLPGMLLPEMRDVLMYFPLTHAVDWFRECFFEGYQSNFVWKPYFLSVTAASVFLGLALERVFRRRISVDR